MNIMLLSVSVWAGSVTDITPETRDFFHWLSALIALPAAAFAGQPFFTSAFKALRNRRTNMDVPISIGVTLALGVSLYETAVSAEHAYFDSAIMLLFFLLAGRTLDQAMRRKTRAARRQSRRAEGGDGREARSPTARASRCRRRRSRRATRSSSGPASESPPTGLFSRGTPAIDESLVTGETLPRSVEAGDAVYAGTLNRDGALTLAVSAAAGGSLVDEVAEAPRQGGRGALAPGRARRPRRPPLRAGRPSHRRALGGGLAARRRRGSIRR